MTFIGLAPYLYYHDAAAALEWLARVFGFEEEVRYLDPQGVVAQADMAIGTSRIMMSGRGPGPAEGPGQLLIVQVDDVDAMYERAVTAGVVLEPPPDQKFGPRTLHVTDPWGYRWSFWQKLSTDEAIAEAWREVSPNAGASQPS